ncbi:MAG: hypothetical protein P4L84_38090 [Isosphaeraceae bacterium]|nr:hypothetical protein [Isosphaeraceae bacterium]
MLRVPLLWMCLIAALAGTPLRQAEAADDLASSLAELAGGHVVEMIDGGVGDDSGETVLNNGNDDHASLAALPSATAEESFVPPPRAPSLNALGSRIQTDQTHAVPAGFVRRHVWLQRFLF